MQDKLDFTVQDHERKLKDTLLELKNNENLTRGEMRTLHVEVEKLEFSIKTLKFIQNENS